MTGIYAGWGGYMIDRYDLYDMSFALILIRSDIRSRSNIPVLARMIDVLEAKEATEDNQIRRALSSIAGLDRERWFFVYHNNVYVNCRMLERKSVTICSSNLFGNWNVRCTAGNTTGPTLWPMRSTACPR